MKQAKQAKVNVNKREHKTGKDFISRHILFCDFIGGCLLFVPFWAILTCTDMVKAALR